MWKAILNSGEKVNETTHRFSKIKNDISSLSFDYSGSEVILPPLNGKFKEFLQFKSGSASLSGGEISVDSQTIGAVLQDDTKILLKFSMKENKIEMIVE